MEGLVLSSSAEPGESGQWIVRWSVQNPGSKPRYLVAQLPNYAGGRPAPDPHGVYLETEGETLRLSKRMWRIPLGVSPLITELPYLVRLEPGESHSGAIRLPAAVARKFPYRVGPRRSGVTRVSQIVVSMGYFEEAVEPKPCAEHPGLYLATYGALESQALAIGPPHEIELEVG